MKNNTLYASNYAYGFEKARIKGVESKYIIDGAEEAGGFKMSSKLEYLEDTYDEKTGTSATAFRDKDTGEVILSYTGTNLE